MFVDNESGEVQTEDEQELVGEGDDVGEEQKENEDKDIYSLSFLNSRQSVEVFPGEQIDLKVEIKNTGTVDWQKENISLNVFGGLDLNKNYYHNSWVTNLRPAVLDTEVPVGEVGAFSFVINVPEESGEYSFKIQAVQVDNNFKYIEGGFWEVILNVEEKEIVEEITEKEENDVEIGLDLSEEDDKNIIEEVVEVIEEIVEEVKEVVKKVFYGGGGGGSPAPVADPEPVVVVENSDIEITSHPTSTIYTVTSTVVISGTKNEATEIVYINTSTADFVSSTFWEFSANLNEGENEFEIYGENSEGGTSITSTVSIFLDTIPPSIPIVTVMQSEYATPTLYISWEATDGGVGLESYDVKYSVSSTETDLFSQTTSTNYFMEVDKLSTYEFRARSYDTLGNISDWSTSTNIIVDWPKTVVINEVAWMGSGPSSKQKTDEWLELYNNTDEDIDIIDWRILLNNAPLNFTTINNSIIPAEGYLLLERTDDDSIRNADADIIYTGSMSNDGAELGLKDGYDNTIDMIDCSSGWYEGSTDGYQYRSMVRVDTNLPGSWESNWQTYQGVAAVAQPYGGSILYGSPGYKNKGYWLLAVPSFHYANLFDANSTWIITTENNPYVLDYETLIPAGYKVQVDPGVIIYGKDKTSYFNVLGELEFNGEENNSVIITSALDTNYVEDNKSAVTGDLAAGDWSRIQVGSSGVLDSTYTKFLYGGNESFFQTGVFVGQIGHYKSNVVLNNGGQANIFNGEFYNNYTQADDDRAQYNSIVWSEDATTTISNSVLNGGANIGAVLYGGYVLLDGVTFSNLNMGLDMQNVGELEMQNITENNFQNISDYNWFPTSTWAFPTSS